MWIFWLFISVCVDVGLSTAPRPPNIIFILADDLGWYDVGFHGSEIKTPNIDKLAYEGVILNNYYVQPICTPTRSAVMSGKYPIHTGLQHYVIAGSQPYGLPLSVKILPQYLRELGYSTHMLGKWHLGLFKKDYLPENRGFDSHFGFYMGHADYFDHYADDGYFGYDLHYNGKTVWNYSEVYSTELYTKHADRIIKSHNASKPLFLYFAQHSVHVGNQRDRMQVPQNYVNRFPYIKNIKRRLYAGMVSALDDSVGAVYEAVQESGMADNTIIVFSTDNGGPVFGHTNNAACNWPLRGNKNTLWQGGVRGVGLVHSPLLQKPGRVINGMMHVVDWLPTLLQAAKSHNHTDRKQEEDLDIDGVGMWAEISRGAEGKWPRQEVLLNIDPVGNFSSVIVGDHKLVQGQITNNGWYPPADGLVSERTSNYQQGSYTDASHSLEWKSESHPHGTPIKIQCGLMPLNATKHCHPALAPCLFDIRSDPCEYYNLASDFPQIVKKLQKKVKKYSSTMIPPGNKPMDPKGNPQVNDGVWKPWM